MKKSATAPIRSNKVLLRSEKDHERGEPGKSAIRALGAAILGCVLTLYPSVMPAQNGVTAQVEKAAAGHGQQWQSGGVKNWVASGTLVLYRYDEQHRQQSTVFPMTLIHEADKSGGGSKADKLQRLVFKAIEPPSQGGNAASSAAGKLYAPNRLLTKEGTDGSLQWFSSGPITARATGGPRRLIEAQTARSVEALLKYSGNGKVLEDITSTILSQAPPDQGKGKGNAYGQDKSRVAPGYEAAKNRHVIQMKDPSAKQGITGEDTRYYIDDGTSLVARVEFDYGTGQDPFSKRSITLTEVWEFFDYRDVPISSPDPLTHRGSDKKPSATVKFPFRIERYVMGQKVETMAFRQVLLNLNLRPENFQR